MKNIFVMPILIGIVIILSSCKKESGTAYVKYYDVPKNRIISTFDDLLNKRAEVEWIVSNGKNGRFTSTVSQIYTLPEGIPVMVVNGTFNTNSNTIDYSNNKQPNFSLLVRRINNSYEVTAFKAFFPGENQTWNALLIAPIGVYEDAFKIVITSNDMFAATEDRIYMSVKITISKILF